MADLQSFHSFCALAFAVLLSLAFTYRFILRLPPGLPRVSFLLPLFPIFFLLPWSISSHHLRAILAFMFLWTLPSKLLLLCYNSCFDFYPRSPSSSGFGYFLISVLLPIRIIGPQLKQSASSDRASDFRPVLRYVVAFISILNVYPYGDRFPPWVIYVLYEVHVYIGLEASLGAMANLAVACFGVEVDPQSNEPFMSASLSDFWGRRWNLVVTSILRSTVYVPMQLMVTRAVSHTSIGEGSPIPRDCRDRDELKNEAKTMTANFITRPSSISRAIAIMTTFLVSGLMHELIFFFMARTPDVGHATAFFLLHGLATVLEGYVRRTFPLLEKLPPAISIPFTLAFVHFTTVWLFFPPLERTRTVIHVIDEYHQFQRAVVALWKS